MDNFDINKIPGNKNLDEPIPLDDSDLDKPIPLDDSDRSKGAVSHSPLSLGAAAAVPPKVKPAAQPARAVAKKPAEKIVSAERISGVKTFFTKLHPGAIDFLDEQINKWLNENPGITIKRTNTVTGEIQGKKTEPNIIVTIWY